MSRPTISHSSILFGLALAACGDPAQQASLDGSVTDAGALDPPSPGYTLFAPMASTTTYLLDLDGHVVHHWASAYRPALAAALADDGTLVRTANPLAANATHPIEGGGAGGRVEALDWDGNVVWSVELLSDTTRQHHDLELLPNGHVLAIVWEAVTEAEAIALGRADARVDARGLYLESVVELARTGSTADVVWSWHAKDHLGTGARRIDVDGGGTAPDFVHLNSVDYDATLDLVLLSSHAFGEVWAIDHGTTTAEAAASTGGARGLGGDLVYRWGNPGSYGAGTSTDTKLFGQHDASFVRREDGSVGVLVFNNGQRRPDGAYSSVDELTLPVEADGSLAFDGVRFGPEALDSSWVADPPTSYYAQNLSSASRLPGGHTLLCNGTAGRFDELDAAGRIVWSYAMPAFGSGANATLVFRADRLPLDHPGLAGRSLADEGPLVP